MSNFNPTDELYGWSGAAQKYQLWSEHIAQLVAVFASEEQTLINKTIDSINNKVGADHLHLKVKAKENIPKGTLVTMTGINQGEDCLEIEIPTDASQLIAGITHYDFANGEFGGIQNIGVYEGLDLSAFSFQDQLFSDGTGWFTTTKPGGTCQRLAFVLKNHVTKGSIYINATAPEETPTIQVADPSSSSAAGFYGATTSGDFFYKSESGLFNISQGTYTAD